MIAKIEQLKSQLADLSTNDRAELAHFLLTTLPPSEGSEVDLDEEISRRVDEINNGARGVDGHLLLSELRNQYPSCDR